MSAADVEGLRSLGLADGAIHDVVQVAALFNYYDRLADGLGIEPEPDFPPAN
jgi:alkylhydroperoxidase family enzyme